MKSSGIGGQAVLEGVMMKNGSRYAVAVRKPDGDIDVNKGRCKSPEDRPVFFRLPIIRGIVAFIDSLVLGMQTLTYSSSFYEEEEEQKGKKNEEQSKRKEQIETVITVIFSIVLAVGIFMVLPFFLSELMQSKIQSTKALAAIEGVIRIALFVGYVLAISLMKDIRRVFMYHGAEHKSINCIEHGMPLTVDNVRKQSKQHKRCGTSFLLIVMFVSIIFFMFIHFDNIWLRMIFRILLVPVIAGVSYEFIRVAGRTDNIIINILSQPGMLLQRLTTREPDDSMIEVAITSVEAVFDWKEYQIRCKAEENSRKRKKENGGASERKQKKSRAEIREELMQRELENKKRAAERAKRIHEQEEKEAEIEKIADAAARKKSGAVAKSSNPDMAPDELASLDIYFDDSHDETDE